jgi:SAM-dependent methyltransferase
LVQTIPMPGLDELKEYYSAFSFLPPQKEAVEEQLAAIRQSLIHHFGLSGTGGTFLDYGGGHGLYAKAASGLGWKVSLFDYDVGALDYAANTLGIEDTTADLESLSDHSFDVIWSFHVAEHWRNIDDSFNDLDRLIKPGGRLVIATPNARSWEKYVRAGHFKTYLAAWRNRGLSLVDTLKLLLRYDSVFCWDPPRHLYAFTPESLRKVAERRGYTTKLRVGTNNDPLFEPRRYILGDPGMRFHILTGILVKRPWRLGAAWALLRLGYEQLCFRILSLLAPLGGEQLYMIFTKKS